MSKKSGFTPTLNPIIEYLAECFAVSAEQVIKDSKKLVKKSLDRKPEARKQKILSFAKQKKEFTTQDILKLFPEVPQRTIERDIKNLVTDKKLKTLGENKNRSYKRMA